MTRHKYYLSLIIVAFAIAFACNAHAAIKISVPEKVARGDAFLASASSSEPLEKLVFHWRGKPYAIPAAPLGNGEYGAEILLPVPLDEKASSLRLGVSGNEKSPGETQAGIQIYEKKRPVQKLKVDKKFVDIPEDVKARIAADREKVRLALQDQLPRKEWSLPLQRPVPGSVSSLFGMKRVFNGQLKSVHRGLDLRGATGTPIHACADGRVALVDNLYYSGNTVYVNHGDGVFTAYLHMSDTKVKPGDLVKKGDVVGLVGSTGRVTGPHLHLSLIVQGQSVDPQPLLEQKAALNK